MAEDDRHLSGGIGKLFLSIEPNGLRDVFASHLIPKLSVFVVAVEEAVR